jgi:filamentous hemagglutinin family protein
MKVINNWQKGIFGTLITCLFTSGLALPTFAQVISDGTTRTIVNPNGKNFTILNGTEKGQNLFHSFSNFSVPTDGSATFDLVNTPNIKTIFSRVTGGNISHIDGLIQTLNSHHPVSLFLMNPNGIMFGANASLNISGSFVGTTAESIKFADGTEFSAKDTSTRPILTMSVPVGLQLGVDAGSIRAKGKPILNFLPALQNPQNPSDFLQSFKAQTVALIGKEIDFDSAIISNPDGRFELWALKNAELGLNNQTGLQISSPISADWGTVTLRKSSLVNTDGFNGGAINIRGRGLTIKEGAGISSATNGSRGKGQGITVKTTEYVELLGVNDPLNYPTPGIFTSVFASDAKAGNITVETPSLRIANGGWLQSVNFGFVVLDNTKPPIPIRDSSTGNITVRAQDVEVKGYNPFPFINPETKELFFRPSAITTLVTGGENNNSGNITIVADRVWLLKGGRISTDLLGFVPLTTGKAGDISIRSTESLEISGTTPDGFTSAVISSIQQFARGQGGNISITTGRLAISNGGSVSSALGGLSEDNKIPGALGGQGQAGNIKIRAKDVEVSNPVIDSVSNSVSGITVAVSEKSIGQGGNIKLTADNLRVFNGGQIISSSSGQGNAGNLDLQVKNIDVQGVSPNLVNGQYLKSAISASSTTGFDAGTVKITANNLLVHDQAEITVSNTGMGDAGNLRINAKNIVLDHHGSLRSEVKGGSQGNIIIQVDDTLVLRRNSNITTNASGSSTGGNISITADSIVAVPGENSDIFANAVLGSGGNIQITAQGIFGLTFRAQPTGESDITASSQYGVNGTVDINNVGVDPNSGLIELPSNVTDPSQKIASGCAENQSSSFIATGRGGIPENPSSDIGSVHAWSDLRDISAYRKKKALQAQIPPSSGNVVQATSWHRNAQGQVVLFADQSSGHEQPYVTCAAFAKIE